MSRGDKTITAKSHFNLAEPPPPGKTIKGVQIFRYTGTRTDIFK